MRRLERRPPGSALSEAFTFTNAAMVDQLRGIGGTVRTIPFVPGRSTTAIIARAAATSRSSVTWQLSRRSFARASRAVVV